MSWKRSSGFIPSSWTSASCTADETPSRYSLDLPRAREILTNGMAILPVDQAWRWARRAWLGEISRSWERSGVDPQRDGGRFKQRGVEVCLASFGDQVTEYGLDFDGPALLEVAVHR